MDRLAIEADHAASGALAQSSSVLDDSLEYWMNVRWRTADNRKNLARSGLLLQGLGEIAIAVLEFLEQADVLNCDNRLCSEGLE